MCPSGYYANVTGRTECIICPEGYSCANTSDTPMECAAGTFAARHGSVSCSNCPSGYYTTMAGQASCVACPQGYRCPNTNEEPISCLDGEVCFCVCVCVCVCV